MEVRGVQPTGESILRTLIELLETQEQVKIIYEIKEGGDDTCLRLSYFHTR